MTNRRPPDGEARSPGDESPIFEEMASAWFRENRGPDQTAERSDVPPARARQGFPPEGAGDHPGNGPGPGQDEGGWDSGESLLRPMPEATEPAEMTTAGLPRRQPRSQLIPSGSSEQNGVPRATFPARSAEQVRGRLASYQHGIRQGRESRHRRTEPDTANAGSRPGERNYEEEAP